MENELLKRYKIIKDFLKTSEIENRRYEKDDVRDAAKTVGKDALDYALYGGEDFELVFTVSENNLNKVHGFLVGEVTKEKSIKITHPYASLS
jgi:thiamine monophosphate kinase